MLEACKHSPSQIFSLGTGSSFQHMMQTSLLRLLHILVHSRPFNTLQHPFTSLILLRNTRCRSQFQLDFSLIRYTSQPPPYPSSQTPDKACAAPSIMCMQQLVTVMCMHSQVAADVAFRPVHCRGREGQGNTNTGLPDSADEQAWVFGNITK